MTTLQLPEEEITRHPPGSAGGGQRRLRWLRDGWSDAAERAGRRWAVLVWALTLAALLAQDPGRMTFDTKLGVNINPVGFYERLWHLWNPLEWLGSLQDQYIGYAFPMGGFYLTAHALHVPVWVAERIWMSLLVTVAFLGIVRLAEALGIGSRPTRLLAGATFALWPTFTILIGSTSAAVLPGVLAPWAVLPLIRGRSARRAAAGSALIVACMGGVNATATLAALVLPGMYAATRPGRRRWELAAWWAPAVLLATSWWLVPLLYQGKYGFNFLPYIEQSANTTQTMSAAAVLRGSGNWVAYLNFGVPWLTAASVVVGVAWAVAAAALAAAAGLGGLARRDLPEALWLRATVAVAALWGLTGYSGPLGGPLHGPVQNLLNGSLSALRNVFKIEPVLAAVLALGIAHVLARALWRWRLARIAGGVAAVAALAGLALPFLTGQALQPGSFTQVPAYWREAASYLAAHHGTETTLAVPADAHGIYSWGQPIDEPLEPLAHSPWVQANLVPYTGGGASDLVSGPRTRSSRGWPRRAWPRTWRGPGSVTSWCATIWIRRRSATPRRPWCTPRCAPRVSPGWRPSASRCWWPRPTWGRPCRYRRSHRSIPRLRSSRRPTRPTRPVRPRPCCPPPRPRSSTAVPPRCCSSRARACWARPAGRDRRPERARHPARNEPGRHRRAAPRRHRVQPAEQQHLLHVHGDRDQPAGRPARGGGPAAPPAAAWPAPPVIRRSPCSPAPPA